MRLALALSLFLPLALSQTACLPSSQRHNTEALTPSDSLSRRVGAEAPVDSLRLVWTAEAPADAPMELPTSAVWLPDPLGGRIVVADTRSGALHVVSSDGEYVEALRPDGLAYPYMAGRRGDTLVVLNRSADRLDFVVGETVARSVPLPEAQIGAVLATDSALYAKRADEDATFLLRLTEAGREAARYRLAGPYWRHIGFLRPWGDSLLSLSGYRPVVDVLAPDAPAGATLDTLALVGFDSPQLVRSYQFLIDEVDEPPLLTSSAVMLDGRLYVLNLRTDRVRIDVYAPAPGGGFRLERVLAYTDPALLENAFPVDLAARRGADGRLRFVVVLQNPGGLLSDPGGRVAMLAETPPQ